MLLGCWLSHWKVNKKFWRINQLLELTRKDNFLSLFIGIRMKTHLHWKTLWFILFKSSFRFRANNYVLLIITAKKVICHRQIIYGLGLNFQASHLCILGKVAVQELPWRTPAPIFVHVECWPLRITLCFLSLNRLVKVSSKSPVTPFCFNL